MSEKDWIEMTGDAFFNELLSRNKALTKEQRKYFTDKGVLFNCEFANDGVLLNGFFSMEKWKIYKEGTDKLENEYNELSKFDKATIEFYRKERGKENKYFILNKVGKLETFFTIEDLAKRIVFEITNKETAVLKQGVLNTTISRLGGRGSVELRDKICVTYQEAGETQMIIIPNDLKGLKKQFKELVDLEIGDTWEIKNNSDAKNILLNEYVIYRTQKEYLELLNRMGISNINK